MRSHRGPIRGRGTAENPPNRFGRYVVEDDPDLLDPEAPGPPTQYLRDVSKTIIATNQSPDVGFDASINPYRGCVHGCAYCLGPDAPVLFADWVWRPIGEVEVGDVLIGFDEFPEPGRTRKYRLTEVRDVWWSRRPTVRLVTECAEVVTTEAHRWLVDARWSCTHDLMVAGRLTSVSGEVTALEAAERGPVRDVVDITTSTGTFFAGGFATHNCFARPTHEYLGFSAGVDFESKIMVKEDAAALLRKELSSPRWKPQTLGLSGVTDPYQPIEKKLRITRACVEVLAEFRNPVAVITKNQLVARDVDLFAELARHGAAAVFVSVTTLRPELQQVLEPRASPPSQRLRAIETLARAGVPVGALVAPVIPALTDHEIPAILEAVGRAGASFASYVMLRLPYGVKDLFVRWLEDHAPERKDKVLSRILDIRDGKLNDANFGTRMRGAGAFADEVAQLFRIGCRRGGIPNLRPTLSAAAFRGPQSAQGRLFQR